MHTETQFGILPTLEFDGKRLSGNGPIARYLAEKYGENFSSLLSLHDAPTVQLLCYDTTECAVRFLCVGIFFSSDNSSFQQ